MERVFISYSHKDKTFARRLAQLLSRVGVTVWIDVENIPLGTDWRTEIKEGLHECEAMILIVTPESLSSPHVETEWHTFRDTEKPIIPVLFRTVSNLPDDLNQLHMIDFCDEASFEESFTRLRRALRTSAQLTALYDSLEDIIRQVQADMWVSGINLNRIKEFHREFNDLLIANPAARLRFMFISPDAITALYNSSLYLGLHWRDLYRRQIACLEALGQLVIRYPQRVEIRLLRARPSCGCLIVDPFGDHGFMTVSPYFYEIDRVKSQVPRDHWVSEGYIAPFLYLQRYRAGACDDQGFKAYFKDFLRQWEGAEVWQPDSEISAYHLAPH